MVGAFAYLSTCQSITRSRGRQGRHKVGAPGCYGFLTARVSERTTTRADFLDRKAIHDARSVDAQFGGRSRNTRSRAMARRAGVEQSRGRGRTVSADYAKPNSDYGNGSTWGVRRAWGRGKSRITP